MNPLGSGDPLRLGPYRLIGVLGAGGMGKVYLGRDKAGKPAAIKVLRPELAHHADLARRFVREAQTAQSVRGKGVARVLGADTESGRPWIACEFLAGPTLHDAVQRYGPLEGPALRGLAASLARTLGDIHAAGLIHRDIKPPNIVLTSGGPRVIDFGIARPEHGLTLTSTGEVPVTPGYGPPEQVLGQRVGPAADVFALGAVLTLAATGKPAFTGGHVAAVQYEVVHGEPQLDGLPADLHPLIAPCLAKDPAHRPTTEQIAAAMAPPRGADRLWKSGPLAEDIGRREQEATRLAALPGPDGEETGVSRRRLLTGLSAAGVVAVAGAASGVWWLRDDEPADEPDDGSGRPAWAAAPLKTYAKGTAPKPLWSPVGGVVSANAVLVPLHNVVVVAKEGGGLQAYAVRDGKPVWHAAEAAAAAGSVALDGSTVLAADAAGTLMALGDRTPRPLWRVRADAARVLAADAKAAYVLTRGGELRAVRLASPRKILWTVPAPVADSAKERTWAVAGQGHVLLAGSDGRIAAVRAADGDVAWTKPKRSNYALPMALGRGEVYAGGDTLAAFRLKDGSRRWSHPARGEYIWGAPALRGSTLYAMNDSALHAVSITNGATGAGDATWEAGASRGILYAPPAVQGDSVWVPSAKIPAEPSQLYVLDASKGGTEAWSTMRSQQESGDWTLTAAGNRVFLIYSGQLTVMPVF
ncbi:protein kinase [Streptomyces sp. A7024]|uniref:Protein kinase n=1 Tax=Streptomyces coryli TaxID=1128680 RepID=A0A6G4U668_9ACTN|nr:serine/threonine-protein kinase [Streptomyces coryli]NGN67206.1 protein kinase [Streptomyces coryli]